ncbi:acetoacetate--CoA ligase [Alteraurantiacibacter aquimixticola]|uniref:Acetoacetate--CoA ligase n=1 Tax=Alteraurantiacibacter aquimixticola TaxID=2489173 RepID=A0A4T3F4I7_9SPHN|nr:acetoacetate--CoA ligase [Alteraurantiacibacter aquimixticola]TIX51701.1 acetoacetate--CoA ligase [Alteraurantiacibacter aquimixticola]
MADIADPQFVPRLALYRDWLKRERNLEFADYEAMWEWSTQDLDGFWRSVWDYFDVRSPTPFQQVVEGTMPFARWFKGASVNYAREVFRHAELADAAGQPAIIAENERGEVEEISWRELRRRSASLALTLRENGVDCGDRVAAYLPNGPEAVIAMLACVSLGAVWTMCAPDMGTPAVLDRFRQAEPKVLIAADGVHYGGKPRDRSTTVHEILAGLPTVTSVMIVRSRDAAGQVANAISFADAIAHDDEAVAEFEPVAVPFEHPLWILYSSGTTGPPKPMVHGHGGVILTGHVGNMHLDLGASYSANNFGERFHWYSSTGWVMWNVQVGGLLSGTTICLYDGAPKGTGQEPDWHALWSFAARHKVTWFGAGAAFYANCRKEGLVLSETGDLSAIRALGTTGSVLDGPSEAWGTSEFAKIGKPGIWWCNISGGTDIAAAFMSGNRELPPTPGRLQCRHLGAAIEAWDENGKAVTGEVGELVCTKPFPSMPLYFWGDEEAQRYCSTYFEEWEGIWRHGDWLTIHPDGSCAISGRSDATINRHGLRMGTAEIYAAVETIDGVEDTLVIELEVEGGDSQLLMFVVPAANSSLDEGMMAAASSAIREKLSPRFIPDHFIAAPGIPRTLSGKKQELPIKRLFSGWPLAKVIDRNLTQNPEVLDWYVSQANTWQQGALEGVE